VGTFFQAVQSVRGLSGPVGAANSQPTSVQSCAAMALLGVLGAVGTPQLDELGRRFERPDVRPWTWFRPFPHDRRPSAGSARRTSSRTSRHSFALAAIVQMIGPLPQHRGVHGEDLDPTVHVDRGYDSGKTRDLLEILGFERKSAGTATPGRPLRGVGG
jgi:hypothetical protein